MNSRLLISRFKDLLVAAGSFFLLFFFIPGQLNLFFYPASFYLQGS
jgi:hypothetical protein